LSEAFENSKPYLHYEFTQAAQTLGSVFAEMAALLKGVPQAKDEAAKPAAKAEAKTAEAKLEEVKPAVKARSKTAETAARTTQAQSKSAER
jgi:hypothetical protein